MLSSVSVPADESAVGGGGLQHGKLASSSKSFSICIINWQTCDGDCYFGGSVQEVTSLLNASIIMKGGYHASDLCDQQSRVLPYGGSVWQSSSDKPEACWHLRSLHVWTEESSSSKAMLPLKACQGLAEVSEAMTD